MKITADTNVLLRFLMRDDEKQAAAAAAALTEAQRVAITLPALCEVVWVLTQGYTLRADDIAHALHTLVNSSNVVVDRQAVEAGLLRLRQGGDFADGVIAHEGRQLGADAFVSFDKKAVSLMRNNGQSARLLQV